MADESLPVGNRKLGPKIVRDGTQAIDNGTPALIALTTSFYVSTYFGEQFSEVSAVVQNGRSLSRNGKVVDFGQQPSARKHVHLAELLLLVQREYSIHCG